MNIADDAGPFLKWIDFSYFLVLQNFLNHLIIIESV